MGGIESVGMFQNEIALEERGQTRKEGVDRRLRRLPRIVGPREIAVDGESSVRVLGEFVFEGACEITDRMLPRSLVAGQIEEVFKNVKSVKPRPAWTGSDSRKPSNQPPVAIPEPTETATEKPKKRAVRKKAE